VQLLQTHDLGLGKRFVAEISQRRALPQRQRLSQRPGCLLRPPCRQGLAAFRDQLLEPADVQLFGKDPQQITRRFGHEATPREHPPQS